MPVQRVDNDRTPEVNNPVVDPHAANAEYVRAAWELEKEGERDLRMRERCSGGMPSHCYSYEPYERALEDFHQVALRTWSELTVANREHALSIAQDDCNGCPDLLESLHKLLVSGPIAPETKELADNDPMGDAEAAVEKLHVIHKRKKATQDEFRKAAHDALQAAKRQKHGSAHADREYDPLWDSDGETDHEEWTEAGYGDW